MTSTGFWKECHQEGIGCFQNKTKQNLIKLTRNPKAVGNVVRVTGQLNALVIDHMNEDLFSYTYVDHYPTWEVQIDFQADPLMTGSVSYPLYAIELVEKGDDFTLCKQIGSNELVYVKNEHIVQTDTGTYFVKTDLSCAPISVKKGDTVSIIDESCSGYFLIKKEGVVGWAANNIFG